MSLADNLVELFKEITDLGNIEPLDAGQSSDGMRRFKVLTSSTDNDLLDLFTFHVAREKEQVVLRAGQFAVAADRDLPAQLPAYQVSDLRPAQVQRLVELEDRAGRGLKDHRLGDALCGVGHRIVGKEDHGERVDLDLAVGQVVVLAHQQLDPVAFQDLGVLKLPRPWRKQRPQLRNTLVGRPDEFWPIGRRR